MTQDELKQLFTICQMSGGLLRPNGNRAGTLNTNGYRRVCVHGKLYQEHNLVWLWHYGVMPTGQIDHINRDKTDNRICNLREVTRLENCQNKGSYKNNTSGTTGVRQLKKW